MIEKKTVEHMASLARMELSSDEIRLYKEQLGEIFAFMEQLGKIDTGNVVLSSNNIPVDWREDRVGKSLSVDDALLNAPLSHRGQFKVNGVLDSE